MGWISSAISAVGSFISSALSTVGPSITGFAKSAVIIIAKLPIPGLDVIKVVSTIANIIHAVCKALGVESEEDPEVLGAKATQCEEKPEDFESTEAYIKYLKEKVELDKERFTKMSEEEKIGCKAIGMSLETKAVEEKIGGIKISPKCLAILAKVNEAGIKIEPNALIEVVKAFKEAGITDLNDVVDYLEGRGDSDRLKTGEVLENALGEGASDKIYELEDAVRKFEGDN